jgi:hypothetical protein
MMLPSGMKNFRVKNYPSLAAPAAAGSDSSQTQRKRVAQHTSPGNPFFKSTFLGKYRTGEQNYRTFAFCVSSLGRPTFVSNFLAASAFFSKYGCPSKDGKEGSTVIKGLVPIPFEVSFFAFRAM